MLRRDIHIILTADTHLGFDEPIRPRVERRRRGADFFANFQRVLDRAREQHVDLLVHGGDLFFRSRVPPAITDRVYRLLVQLADDGIPLLIVPGNHERSVLPTSLFLAHPNIHVFTRPETKVFEFDSARMAFAGIPCARNEIRTRFRSLLAETGWADVASDARFLCLHQAVEGARVGPADFTFRHGDDVIPMADLPFAFDAVLAGHIHRQQILTRRRPDGTSLPVVYPGSIERTSFAERFETKGYFEVTVAEAEPDTRPRLDFAFVPLPARPMEDITVEPGIAAYDLGNYLRAQFDRLDPDSVVRIRCLEGVPPAVRAALTGPLLRAIVPPTMNVDVAGDFFAPRRRSAG